MSRPGSRNAEGTRLTDLLRKIYQHSPHSAECRYRRTYPVGPEEDLCDCYRADLARELGIWKRQPG